MRADRLLSALSLLVLAAGCTMVGQPVPGAPAHHREYGFANPSGLGGASAIDWLVDRARLALFASEEESPAPALPPGEAALAWEAVAGDAAQWLGHATVRLRIGGTVLLIDPVVAEVVSPLPPFGPARASPAPLPPAQLDDVDAILITHDHYDHFEPQTVSAVAAEGARCLMPLGVAAGEGALCALSELDWGESATVGALTVTLVPAQHESGRGLFDRDRSLWGAWLIEGSGRRVYLSGDGGYGGQFAEIAKPVDLAVLSVGGYEPRGVNHGVHMDPQEAIRAFQDLGARRALIVHWGTYPLGLESGGETVERVRAAAEAAGLPPDAVVFLAIGEVLEL